MYNNVTVSIFVSLICIYKFVNLIYIKYKYINYN